MKKLLLFSVVVMLTFACNKLTDKNIVGTWDVTEYKENGIVYPLTGTAYFEFSDAGVASFYVDGQLQGSGPYTVSDDGETLTMDGVVFTVLEKKSKTMKLQWTDGTDTEEWSLEKR